MGLLDQVNNQVTTNCGTNSCSDTTPPPTIKVVLAEFGDLINIGSGAGKDPFILELANIEPGTKLQIRNLSANPAAEWATDATELAKIPLERLPNGSVRLIWSDKEAAGFGIQPGDTFDIRQVDAAGNASEGTRVALPNSKARGERGAVFQFQSKPVDYFNPNGSGIDQVSQYRFTAYSDNRPPVAVPKNMTLSLSAAGKPELCGNKCFEPDVTVTLRNERTKQTFTAKTDANGAFTLPFEANLGDPINVIAMDKAGLTTDLGVINFCPVISQTQAHAVGR